MDYINFIKTNIENKKFNTLHSEYKKGAEFYIFINRKTCFLNEEYENNFSQRIWHIYHEYNKIYKCSECEMPAKYNYFKKGYRFTCSQKCANKRTQRLGRKIKKEIYGDENYNNIEKTRLTKNKKYGNENYNNRNKVLLIQREEFKKSFFEKVKVVHKNKYDYSKVEYINTITKVIITCKKCNKEFKQTPASHLFGTGCPSCAIKNNGLKKRNSQKDIIKRFKKIHGNKFDYSLVKYKNLNTNVSITCKKTGNKFKRTPKSHISGNGCLCCKKSKGEAKLEGFLYENKIKFKKEKSFDNCIFKNILFYDFYLQKNNLLIEYDGKQHFEPVQFGGTSIKKAKIEFEKTKKRDKIKNEFAKNNNIELLRIPYTEFNRIEEILTKKLL